MKILGYTWEVIEGNEFDEFSHFGRMIPQKQRIVIAKDICDEQKISTLIHEVIEALLAHLGFEVDHTLITSLEAALYTVLVDNGVDLTPLLDLISKKQ